MIQSGKSVRKKQGNGQPGTASFLSLPRRGRKEGNGAPEIPDGSGIRKKKEGKA